MAKKRKKKTVKPIQGQGFVMVEIDNPNYNPSHAGASGNPAKAQAYMNPKESPAAWYHHYGYMTGPQYQAAVRFRMLHERSGGSGAQAIDYTKEPVDGGKGASDGLTQARMDAAQELSLAYHKIGSRDYETVMLVCGELCWLKQLEPTRYMQKKRRKQLCEALETLAIMWRFQSRVEAWRAA
jgi:hypothetical protein